MCKKIEDLIDQAFLKECRELATEHRKKRRKALTALQMRSEHLKRRDVKIKSEFEEIRKTSNKKAYDIVEMMVEKYCLSVKSIERAIYS